MKFSYADWIAKRELSARVFIAADWHAQAQEMRMRVLPGPRWRGA
jgi:hypothetical protein